MKIIQKILIILFFISVFGQIAKGQASETGKMQLTGILKNDSRIISNYYSETKTHPFADDIPGRKTPMLAGLFSAIIPGAGQVYNEDYWIAGIFIALEAALITTAIIYDKKGDDQTKSFQNFADENWSVVDYAKWLNQYRNHSITIDETTPGLKPWERVNWTELNAAENQESDLSHTLPPYGDQQYYEQIGKYLQYSSGWNDFPGGANQNIVSPNFKFYSGERGQANDFYNTASTAVVGIYINHLLSAAEAVWGATRFNSNLLVNLRVETINLAGGIELVPTLKMKFSF
ncbi:MAG: hypothetical protein HKP17_04860 [Ignavibacteriaceae bacterium]|nr:hypothetical protein [Ignavibacteriaceae bacterium]